ncbi:hypothetical protein C0J52_09948 [Blattella germanica]|nr:hypothetical protein C0J52_09948 [Blattella germanica]
MNFCIFIIISAVAIFSAVKGEDCPPGCSGCESRSDGESWPGQTNDCIGLTCHKVNGEYGATGVACAHFQVGPQCEIVPGKKGVPYPDCCPHPVC